MAKKTKVLRMSLPLSFREWRRGQRYVLTEITTSEVQIVYHTTRKEEQAMRTETHKIMKLHKRLPWVLRSLIPDDACIVDEYSTSLDTFSLNDTSGNNYENIHIEAGNREGALAHFEAHKIETPAGVSLNHCITTYKNRYFDSNTFTLKVRTKVVDEPVEDPFGLGPGVEEFIDLRDLGKDIPREGDERPSVECYKVVEVSVNRSGFGWVAKKVAKMLKEMLLDVQKQIVQSYDKWKDMTEEDLRSREQDMIKKLIVEIKEEERVEQNE